MPVHLHPIHIYLYAFDVTGSSVFPLIVLIAHLVSPPHMVNYRHLLAGCTGDHGGPQGFAVDVDEAASANAIVVVRH